MTQKKKKKKEGFKATYNLFSQFLNKEKSSSNETSRSNSNETGM